MESCTKISGIGITIRTYFTADSREEVYNELITVRQDFTGDEFNKAFAEQDDLYKERFNELLEIAIEKIRW